MAKEKYDPFRPENAMAILVKLGSIAVHAEELISDDGHAFDKVALEGLLADPDIKKWLKEMDRQGLLPKKRNK